MKQSNFDDFPTKIKATLILAPLASGILAMSIGTYFIFYWIAPLFHIDTEKPLLTQNGGNGFMALIAFTVFSTMISVYAIAYKAICWRLRKRKDLAERML